MAVLEAGGIFCLNQIPKGAKDSVIVATAFEYDLINRVNIGNV